MVDSFCIWCEAISLKSQEAFIVAKALFKKVICRYGSPLILAWDRGHSLCELFDITRHNTSSYYPHTNSTVERLNSTIAHSLRMYGNAHSNWPKLLPRIMKAFRMSPATQSIQCSPHMYELVFENK